MHGIVSVNQEVCVIFLIAEKKHKQTQNIHFKHVNYFDNLFLENFSLTHKRSWCGKIEILMPCYQQNDLYVRDFCTQKKIKMLLVFENVASFAIVPAQ